MTIKATKLAIPAEEAIGIAGTMLKEDELNPARKDSSFQFTLLIAGTVSLGELTILPVEADVKDSVQVRLNYQAKYRKLSDNFIDLQDAVNRIQKMVREHFPRSQEFVTVIEFGGLKGIYETVGFLASEGLESLSTKKGKTQIDLSGDKVTLYGSLTSELKAVIQEIVAYYG